MNFVTHQQDDDDDDDDEKKQCECECECECEVRVRRAPASSSTRTSRMLVAMQGEGRAEPLELELSRLCNCCGVVRMIDKMDCQQQSMRIYLDVVHVHIMLSVCAGWAVWWWLLCKKIVSSVFVQLHLSRNQRARPVTKKNKFYAYEIEGPTSYERLSPL